MISGAGPSVLCSRPVTRVDDVLSTGDDGLAACLDPGVPAEAGHRPQVTTPDDIRVRIAQDW